jgi:hypothetical protein
VVEYSVPACEKQVDGFEGGKGSFVGRVRSLERFDRWKGSTVKRIKGFKNILSLCWAMF